MAWQELAVAVVVDAVLAVALYQWIRRGGKQRRDIFLGTVPLAVLFTVPLFGMGQWYALVLLVAMVLAPVAYLLMVRHIRSLSWAMPLIVLLGGTALVALVALELISGEMMLAGLAGLVIAPYLVAATMFFLEARRRRGVGQRRLIWTAINGIVTAVLLFTSFAEFGLAQAFEATTFVQAAFAASFVMGFTTPRFVRAQWRALEFRRFVEATQDDPDKHLTDRLETMRAAAASVVEADAVFLLEEDDERALCVTHDDPFPEDSDIAWDLLEASGSEVVQLHGWTVLGLHAPDQPRRALVICLSKSRLFPGEDDDMLELLANEIAARFKEAAYRHVEQQGRLAAEELAKFRSEFLRAVAHEIANPLSPIKMQMSILRRNYAQEAPRPFERIDRSVDRIEALIRDISTIARLGTAGMHLGVEEVDLSSEVQGAVDAYEDIGREAGCEVVADVEAGIILPADGLRIRQVIDNLLSNAIKYSPDGGKVDVRLRQRGGLAEIQIRDEGLGMDADQLARLFSTYGRVHTEVAPQIAGTGMGLYIARQLARLHGGDLSAHSNGPGTGTLFTLSLPLEGPPDEVEAADRPPMPGVRAQE